MDRDGRLSVSETKAIFGQVTGVQYDGRDMSVAESFADTVSVLNAELDAIRDDNEFNNMPIKAGKRDGAYLDAFCPAQRLGAVLMQSVEKNKGWGKDACDGYWRKKI